jgi:hypothetical protein
MNAAIFHHCNPILRGFWEFLGPIGPYLVLLKSKKIDRGFIFQIF